jgi:16S rRNA (cytosine967-C5)-methyltransferase
LVETRYALTLRSRAVHILTQVFSGSALNAAIDEDRTRHGRHGLVEELAIGTVRQSLGLAAVVTPLLRQPFKNSDQDLFALLLMGLYQALYMQTPGPGPGTKDGQPPPPTANPWAAA